MLIYENFVNTRCMNRRKMYMFPPVNNIRSLNYLPETNYLDFFLRKEKTTSAEINILDTDQILTTTWEKETKLQFVPFLFSTLLFSFEGEKTEKILSTYQFLLLAMTFTRYYLEKKKLSTFKLNILKNCVVWPYTVNIEDSIHEGKSILTERDNVLY